MQARSRPSAACSFGVECFASVPVRRESPVEQRFLSHHLARISTAAVYWDARHIDEVLKQRAQPHA